MKRIFIILFIVHCSLIIAFAIVPKAFKYQAVVRDNNGNVIANQAIILRISIIKNNISGTVVYSEEQPTTTNNLGWVVLNIGEGINKVGLFSNINWSIDSYFLKIEFKTEFGIYQVMGTSQLLSVPYALYAEKSGTIGTTGPTGNTGTPGPTGPIGLNGLNGTTGPTGSMGLNGLKGATGSTGPMGLNGLRGATGPTGSSGANGLNGVTGPTGPSGFNGLNGVTGPTGLRGITGFTGAMGLNGLRGATGPTGFSGANGLNGVTGSIGPTGANGLNGVTGPTGPSGVNGLNGVTGPTGLRGITGLTGPMGLNGLRGATGPTGSSGANGLNGVTGSIGPTGANGLNGITGPTGTMGPNGLRGITGLTGPMGLNGLRGITGPTGNTGANGLNGTTGPTGPIGLNGLKGTTGTTGPTGPIGPTGPVIYGSSTLPSGIKGQTLINNGSSWLASSLIYNSGTYVGVGTTTPTSLFQVNGTLTTNSLRILGGSDIAEPFDVLEGVILPGMVLSIDTDNPGKLKIASVAYDKTVAGIVSGANSVKPGLIMSQEDIFVDGKYPVALTGRVYCYADATSSPIKPGDLLTTSDIPGYSMKVTDHLKAQGAIIGKAMTGLKNGKGLILVLVSLQ